MRTLENFFEMDFKSIRKKIGILWLGGARLRETTKKSSQKIVSSRVSII